MSGSRPKAARKQPSRLLLLVQDRAGYRNLCTLLTRAWTEPQARGQAWLAWRWLAECAQGLIALSGADQGAVGQVSLARDEARARAAAAVRLAEIFPAPLLHRAAARRAADARGSRSCGGVPLAAALGLPVVATHPVQFLEPGTSERARGAGLRRRGRDAGQPAPGEALQSRAVLPDAGADGGAFADLPSALANSVQIAKRRNLTLTLGQPQLPAFPIPLLDGEQLAPEAYFRELAPRPESGWQGLPDAAQRDRERPRYAERLAFEIETIPEDGLPGYFLIVADFINWRAPTPARSDLGRGSGAVAG